MTWGATRSVGCLTALLCCAILADTASAQAPPPQVFGEVQTALGPLVSPALEPATMRSRVVQVNTQKITAARRGREVLKLNLFADEVVEVDIKRVRPTRAGHFISGTPKGAEWGDVRLVVNGPVMVGTVITPQGKFTIRSAGSSRHVIRQIDPAKEPFECEVQRAPTVSPASPGELPAISSIGPPDRLPLSSPPIQAGDMPTEDGSEVRILVVYTPALQSEQGGPAGMRALIDLMIETANQAFEDSGINPRLVLAHSALVDYVAQGTHTDLNRLLASEDGQMDEVHALRNEYAADLVHLLTNVSDGPVGSAIPFSEELLHEERRAAFAVTAHDSEETFTHEVGHNFGMAHDRYWAAGPEHQIYPYAYGYVNKRAFEPGAPASSWWSTIMATWRRCIYSGIDCSRLLRFSNPEQTHLGDPLGVPDDSTVTGPDGPADGRRTINNTARWVGSFRSEACTEFVVSPQEPVASVDGGEIALEVDTAPGCLWDASSQSGFLALDPDIRSAGSGYARISVHANETGAERKGSLTVAGKSITVRQLATDAGVCGRTPAVMREIAQISGVGGAGNCDQVTDQHLAGITHLHLYGKGITSLKADDFEGLTSLERIELYDNRLTDLPVGIFDGLSNLEGLSLGRNRLTHLPGSLFANLSKLQGIGLGHNRLIELPEGLFAGLENLESLSLHSNKLVKLPPAIFSGLLRLQDLNLGHNELVGLPEGVLQGLHELERLRLMDNQLTELSDETFGSLAKLKRLDLRGNRITRISAHTFSGLSQLEELLLYDNELTELPEDAFSDLGNLKRLLLGENPFLTLPAGIFSNVPNLIELGFFNGDMTMLPAGVFSGLTNLESLDLTSNELNSLPRDLLKDLPGLKSLILRNNEFTEVPPQFAQGLWRLDTLSLRENRIASLSSGAFAGLSALATLSLTSNRLETLPASAFSDLQMLENLSIANNKLESLPDGIFSGLANLKALDVRTNRVDPLDLSITLEVLGDTQFKAVVPTGAPLGLELPIDVSGGGSIENGESTLTISTGALESEPLSVARVEGTKSAVSVNLGELPRLPSGHQGYALRKDRSLPIWVLQSLNPSDAALIGLSLSDGTLGPAFATDTVSYTASVPRSVSILTVTPEPANESATVAYVDSSGEELHDADSNSAGHQVNLSVGENEIRVMVTSSDNTVTRTYTVTVTREPGICDRTPAVMEAIMAELSSVEDCEDVTTSHLLEIHVLSLGYKNIDVLKPEDFAGLIGLRTLLLNDNELKSLPSGVFGGLTALQDLWLSGNQLTSVSSADFADLTALRRLSLSGNQLTAVESELFAGLTSLQELSIAYMEGIRLSADSFSALTSLRNLHLEGNELTDLPVDIFSGLSSLKSLWLQSNELEKLPPQVFSGLEKLEILLLDYNRLARLPDGVFSGLRHLRELRLQQRAGDLRIPVSLAPVGGSQLRAIAPTGAPFTMEVRISVSEAGLLDGDADTLVLRAGEGESEPIRVSRLEGTTEAVTTDIDALPELPENHSGYVLEKTGELPLEIPSPGEPVPLGPVTGITLTAGVGTLQVAWKEIPDSDGYKVEWKSGGEDYDESRQAIVIGSHSTSHLIPGLTLGTEYKVRVIATREGADDGAPSDEVSGIPRAASPSQVTGVAAERGLDELTVSWDAVSAADGYRVEWKSGDQDYSEARQVALLGSETTSYTIIDLTADTEYTVRVIATKDNADDGPPSEEVTATTVSADPDVNGDGTLNGNDALIMYNAYASGAQLGDGETGGTAASRQTLLAGYSGKINPTDDELKAMIRKANAWKGAGVGAGGDINEDGLIDESDALVMYYAYTTANLVGDGNTGGTERFRQLLLASFANKVNPTDEDLKAMLRRANRLREEFD